MKTEFEYGKPCAPDLIAQFEREFDVKLPAVFVSTVLSHDGAYLSPGTLVANDSGMKEIVSLDHLLPFQGDAGSETMFTVNRDLREKFPGFVFIGADGGGDDFVLDFRSPSNDPPVYVIQSRFGEGKRLRKVADTFGSLLEAIVDEEEAERLHASFSAPQAP